MRVLLTLAILSGMAPAQQYSLAAGPSDDAPIEHSAVNASTTLNSLPDLPPLPRGKSTVIGGAIQNVDLVRDQLTIAVFGGRPIKILFDERTQVYRDGVRSSLADLRGGERVSLETMLDGSAVFARSIHMLSQSMEGECHGQVLEFDRNKGELIVRDALSPQPIKLHVASSTTITREGQQASAAGDLGPGALVFIRFQPDSSGIVARQIAILATEGTAFVFTGRVTFLDLHSGLLVVTDPRDNKPYEIDFNPAQFTASRDLHEGTEVIVKAGFDGTRYTARAITIDSNASR